MAATARNTGCADIDLGVLECGGSGYTVETGGDVTVEGGGANGTATILGLTTVREEPPVAILPLMDVSIGSVCSDGALTPTIELFAMNRPLRA